MPRGERSSYTDKQKKQAQHTSEGYKTKGSPEKETKRRTSATVQKKTGNRKKT